MEKKCKDLVKEAFKSRMGDIKKLYKAGNGVEVADLGRLEEYGLCVDRVESGTFGPEQKEYRRYQISWGGPSEEFRWFNDGRVEFWYLDWFDGAKVTLNEKDANIIKDIIDEALATQD